MPEVLLRTEGEANAENGPEKEILMPDSPPGRVEAARIHIMLVEDDAIFAEVLQGAIETATDMRLVKVATTRAAALQALKLAPADVLLVDLGLPDGSGIDVIRAARAEWPHCAIMVCTTFGDEMHVVRSIESGANGYLLKDDASQTLVEEIRSLHRGGSPISPLIARQVLMRFRQTAAPPEPEPETTPGAARPEAALSPREQQVLEFITKGFTYDEIAGLMEISRYTVMTFVRRIYAKLEVKSKTEAVHEARIKGLLPR